MTDLTQTMALVAIFATAVLAVLTIVWSCVPRWRRVISPLLVVVSGVIVAPFVVLLASTFARCGSDAVSSEDAWPDPSFGPDPSFAWPEGGYRSGVYMTFDRNGAIAVHYPDGGFSPVLSGEWPWTVARSPGGAYGSRPFELDGAARSRARFDLDGAVWDDDGGEE